MYWSFGSFTSLQVHFAGGGGGSREEELDTAVVMERIIPTSGHDRDELIRVKVRV